MISVLFIVGCLILAAAFRWYGRYIETSAGIDPARSTPSHTMTDSVDYVPTRDLVLFGHHFSSIAGAGPIAGPIIAGLAFGWAPAVVWILLGSIFIGGVHDFLSMFVSIRNQGRSIGQICRAQIGRFTYTTFLLFVLFTLAYVIIVFLDMTALTFAPPASAAALTEEAVKLSDRQGGAVATASVLYIVLAVLFGLSLYKFKLRLGAATLVFVPLVFLALAAGHLAPLLPTSLPAWFGSVKNFWIVILLAYCLLASVLPVWILLQPRDYLSSYLLYACLLGGAVGLLASSAAGQAAATYPAFVGFHNPAVGGLFPFLFISIACGAVSGFHSIVSSGTTAKQLDAERSVRRIGYGSMLVEAVLAMLALATVMILQPGAKSGNPVLTFSQGIGTFLQALGLDPKLGATFGMLAVSTFLLTTLDTCTRLTRFIIQELFGIGNTLAGRLGSTLAALVLPALVVFQQITDASGAKVSAWKAIWPAFGASNQLLAALALIVIFVWLKRNGRPVRFVAIPMVFMCATTLTALVQLAWNNLRNHLNPFVGGISAALFVLAVAVIVSTALSFRRAAPSADAPQKEG